jgi:hypothetical protein
MSVDVNVPERITDQALDPGHNTEDCESDAAAASHGLFITPTRRGDSFKASIHGHMLELADPTDHRLAPKSSAEGVGAALAGAFANSLAARPLAERVVHISFEGVNP